MIDDKRGFALNTMETMAVEIYRLVSIHYHSSTLLPKLSKWEEKTFVRGVFKKCLYFQMYLYLGMVSNSGWHNGGSYLVLYPPPFLLKAH